MPKYLKNILVFLAVYAIIFGFYLHVSPNIGDHAFGLHSRRFIPAALACTLPYFLFKEFSLKNLINQEEIPIFALLYNRTARQRITGQPPEYSAGAAHRNTDKWLNR